MREINAKLTPLMRDNLLPNVRLLFIGLLAFNLFFARSGYAQTPPEDMYYRIEAAVFDRNLLNQAIAQLRTESPKGAWTYLTASLAVLISGYKIGDWYSMESFEPGTADQALELALKAKAIDPKNSQCHAHYARILILKGEYELAWKVLNEAHSLAPDSFYPWYFRGIIAEKKRDAVRASNYFTEAERRVAHPYQGSLVNNHRQKVAKFSKDYDEQERLLKENIARSPEASVYYGNYAHFLMQQKRYDEAISYWEKAIAKGPYQHAFDKLKEAKALRDAQR